jgi:hypothetical protein
MLIMWIFSIIFIICVFSYIPCCLELILTCFLWYFSLAFLFFFMYFIYCVSVVSIFKFERYHVRHGRCKSWFIYLSCIMIDTNIHICYIILLFAVFVFFFIYIYVFHHDNRYSHIVYISCFLCSLSRLCYIYMFAYVIIHRYCSSVFLYDDIVCIYIYT